ncbi:MAG: TatD family hydrolase [Bacteroidales bacterium]|nr:TatD family hydrolase [Bacteroidales bacterium]
MKIDIHRHAADPGEADRVLRNLFHNQGQELAKPGLYSAGLHPWQIRETSLQKDLESVTNMAKHESVLAIGETGLDKACKVPFPLQHRAFLEQVKLAKELGKPLIIHCVRAYQEVFEVHREMPTGTPWIIHWFNASAEMAQQLIRQGFYLSFGSMLFREDSKAFKAFSSLPEDKIFLETDDAGFSISGVYEKAALLRGLSLAAMEELIESNFLTCFQRLP